MPFSLSNKTDTCCIQGNVETTGMLYCSTDDTSVLADTHSNYGCKLETPARLENDWIIREPKPAP